MIMKKLYILEWIVIIYSEKKIVLERDGMLSQRNNRYRVGKVLLLHAANPGLILCTDYGPLNTTWQSDFQTQS